jgi:hypothetical protein
MTEAEWLACTDPTPMLNHLAGKVGERKARLLRVAAARLVWSEVTDPQLRAAVEVAERHADGLDTDEELRNQSLGLYMRYSDRVPRFRAAQFDPTSLALSCVNNSRIILSSIGGASWGLSVRYLRDRLPPAVRDIFGNPFRPVVADPAWLSSTAVGLASAIYAERAFDRLPILADVLEDAGCANPDVLAHCRSHPDHARGCWVVDLILGKA